MYFTCLPGKRDLVKNFHTGKDLYVVFRGKNIFIQKQAISKI